MNPVKNLAIVALLVVSAAACTKTDARKSDYKWTNITPAAEFRVGYNYPVYVMNGKMVAFHDGAWRSDDGKNWRKTALTDIGLNSAFQRFVQFKGHVYALGTMSGNIESMRLTSQIARTADGESWEIVAKKSNLPERVFYAAAVFKDKIWIFGGMMNGREFDDVWNSDDGVNWRQAGTKMPWGARDGLKAIVFRDRIYLLGDRDVWSSADGLEWKLETEKMAAHPVFISGYSAVVFDDRIWLIGINRNGTFQSGVLVSKDGRNWSEMSAPWSPRGAVAAWVFGDRLLMTGGKSSYVERGETKFVYSNDVWALEKR